MKFRTLKNLTQALLIVALAGYIAAALSMQYWGGRYAELCAYTATGLLVLVATARLILGKCPHCNMHISRKQFHGQQCPYCGKSLLE